MDGRAVGRRVFRVDESSSLRVDEESHSLIASQEATAPPRLCCWETGRLGDWETGRLLPRRLTDSPTRRLAAYPPPITVASTSKDFSSWPRKLRRTLPAS